VPGVPIDRWWETFHDPKLNALMEEVFSKNLDLEETYARLDQEEALYRAVRADRRPSLEAKGEWTREDTPSFFGNNTGDSYRLSLAAGFEVDLWRKLKSRERAARLEMAASRADLSTLYLTLSARLVDNYYLVAEQRAQIRLADRTIGSFAETLEQVRRRYLAGLVSALDLYQAQQNLAEARARRPVFQSTLSQAEHSLAVLLGRYPGHDPAGNLSGLPETPAVFPAGLPATILERRPDIKAAFLRVRASDARIAAAVADRFPSFNLLANYGKSSLAFSTGDLKGVFWKIFADTAFPILDGKRRQSEVERSRAVFREELAQYQKTVLTAFQEVEDALARNHSTEDRIRRLQERADATEAALRLSRDRYLQGLSDYLPVLTAQTLHFNAESDLLSARRQLISDRVSLARALGGDWMESEIEKHFAAGGDSRDRSHEL